MVGDNLQNLRKKNVALMVSNISTLGGAERVTAILSELLSQYYNCSIITQWFNNKYSYNISNNVDVFNLYTNKRRLVFSVFDSVYKIRKYIINNNIDVLLIIGRNNGILPFLLKPFIKSKIIFCEHSTINTKYINKKMNFKETIYNKILKWNIVNCSDRIVVLTEKEANNYMNILNIKKERIEVIPNVNRLPNSLYGKYNVKSRIICTVGRIEDEKGTDLLFDVAKKVFALHKNWEWHLYGNGHNDYILKLKEKIHNAGLEKNFLIMGPTLQVDEVMMDSSFFVFGSRYEGFGLVLLEAKNNKLPLVSFDIYSGPSDIIRDGIDGFLIEPFNIYDMANKICELIENKELRQRFSDNSSGNLCKFDKDTIIKKWCTLIDNI